MSRCVRRALLCGKDPLSGEDFSYRRLWVKHRLQKVAASFGIEVFAYAVMSNHLHVVLRTDPRASAAWGAEEVVRRWNALFPQGIDANGKRTSDISEQDLARLAANTQKVELWRQRLSSVSWVMRCLNEHIARRANREDECKGRFWEGRYRCQRLDDEAAVLACMVYVDLNPIRACEADCPEKSDYTSIQERILAGVARRAMGKAAESALASGAMEARAEMERETRRDGWLCAVEKVRVGGREQGWGLGEEEYVRLVETTGRQARGDGKRGVIGAQVAALWKRQDMEEERWMRSVTGYGEIYGRVAGGAQVIKSAARELGQHWLWGSGKALR